MRFHQAAQLQQECFLCGVAFGEDVVMVVEQIESLGELEGVLGDEGRLLGADGGVDLRIKRGGEQRQFPEGVAVGAGE